MQNSLIMLVLTDVHEKVFRFVLLVVVWLRDVRVGIFRVLRRRVRRRCMWKLVTASGRSRHDAVRHEARRLVPSLGLALLCLAALSSVYLNSDTSLVPTQGSYFPDDQRQDVRRRLGYLRMPWCHVLRSSTWVCVNCLYVA